MGAEWERQEGVRSDEGLQREAWVRAQKGVREDDALRLCLSLAIDGDAAAAATTLDALASAERDAWVARRGGAPAVAELAALGRLQLLGLRRRRLELLAHLNWIVAVRRRIATEEEVLQARSRGERAWEDGAPVPTEHEATLAARLEFCLDCLETSVQEAVRQGEVPRCPNFAVCKGAHPMLDIVASVCEGRWGTARSTHRACLCATG